MSFEGENIVIRLEKRVELVIMMICASSLFFYSFCYIESELKKRRIEKKRSFSAEGVCSIDGRKCFDEGNQERIKTSQTLVEEKEKEEKSFIYTFFFLKKDSFLCDFQHIFVAIVRITSN